MLNSCSRNSSFYCMLSEAQHFVQRCYTLQFGGKSCSCIAIFAALIQLRNTLKCLGDLKPDGTSNCQKL